jgi:ribosomal-protein-alanine N-acetyltransferase
MAALHAEIGLAGIGEAPVLAQLSRDLIEAGLGWEYRPQRIAAIIADAETATLVTRVRTRPVGFAAMRFGEDRAHLILLAVRPAYQRRGLARAMLDWLLQSALVAGVASIHVELRADNASAFAFYRSTGFTETFRVPGYYRGREAAVRMVRMLRAPSVPRASA